MPNVVVYGASSPQISPEFLQTGRDLGRALAEAGFAVVSGGGRSGMMAAVIEGASEVGGTTIGVLPQFMIDRGWNHPALTSTIVTPDMHARKSTMASMSCAAIAMPGGVGTFEELLEIITWRQLGLFQGRVIIFNIDGYYDPLIQLLENAIELRFMNPDHRNLYHLVDNVEQAVRIAQTPAPKRDFTQKIV